MSAISCCLWWLLAGIVIGWILNWLLSKLMQTDPLVVEKRVEVPVERVVEKIVEKPVDRIVEKVVEVEKIVYRDAPASTASLAVGALAGAAAASGIDFASAAKHGFKVRGDDDLTVVEGIGPAIARLLNQNGVHTFIELSKQTVDQLYAILQSGGERFRNHHPQTWAKQAQMAAENRWDELRAWQDSLDGGLERSDS